jgi:hypothetical protein
MLLERIVFAFEWEIYFQQQNLIKDESILLITMLQINEGLWKNRIRVRAVDFHKNTTFNKVYLIIYKLLR